jgi:hypothetical protein
MTKKLSVFNSSPAMLAGLFFVIFSLTGCQTVRSPEEVTRLFWQSLAQGQLEQARNYATQNTRHLVELKDIDTNSTVSTDDVKEEEGDDARVPTTIAKNRQQVAFDTVLHQENGDWKVDYLRTQFNMTLTPLGDMAKALTEFGGSFAKELQQQMPEIQRQMESFGQELRKQMEGLSRALKLPPPNQPGNGPGQGKSI